MHNTLLPLMTGIQAIPCVASARYVLLIAESLRREGVMGKGASAFGPSSPVSRVEQAVALVRALRLDAQANYAGEQ